MSPSPFPTGATPTASHVTGSFSTPSPEKNERGRQEGREKGKETRMKEREIGIARLLSFELLNEIINVSFWG